MDNNRAVRVRIPADRGVFGRCAPYAASARDDPDSTLVTWVNHEYVMFRQLEAQIVERNIRRDSFPQSRN